MVDLELIQTLQGVSYIAGAIGVCIAAYYYVKTLKNTETLRRKDIMFQIQAPRSPEYYATYADVLRMHDYTTTAEWNTKYTVEDRQKANYLYIHFNMLGILLKDGIASAEEIFQLYPTAVIIRLWEVLEIVIRERRVYDKEPDFCEPFELLYKEARKKNPDYVVSWKRAASQKKEE